jgi:hypothetical protein
MRKTPSIFRLACVGLALLAPAADAASPWLPAPDGGNVSLAYIFQTADRFWVARNYTKLPSDLQQSTGFLRLEYGLTDWLTADAQIGYAGSDFPAGSPSGLSGLTDTLISLRARLLDEATDDWPTVTLRVAGILAGSYRTNFMNSIGDGASGFEVSGIVGKIFENGISLSGEVGYRARNEGVPDDAFYRGTVGYAIVPEFRVDLSYLYNHALSGPNIGDPGFTFPQVQEDYQIFDASFSYDFAEQWQTTVGYATVVNGKNTAASDIAQFRLAYSF